MKVFEGVLFLTGTFLCNYADDNNLYMIGKDCDIIKKNQLQKDFRPLTEWFFKNYKEAEENNTDKEAEENTASLSV